MCTTAFKIINNNLLSKSKVMNILTFVCFNYEIMKTGQNNFT